MAETKSKPAGSLRMPGPKKKLGLTVPPALRMPHEDLITPEVSTLPSQTTPPSQASETRQSRHTRQGRQTGPGNLSQAPVAPERAYMKVANSVVNEAVTGGYFKGKSKQLYDCLYLLTRGAVVPTRRVRISRPKLMVKAHIGSRVTFDTNVRHLQSINLIRVIQISGEHEGNEYEVFLPEEVSLPSMPSMPSQSGQTGPAHKEDRLDSLESSQTGHTSSDLDSITLVESQTSSSNLQRPIDDDDAALAGLVTILNQLSKELTGRETTIAELERWNELAGVLATEARIAGARTTISSLPAFLAEHLRRRLWKKDKSQLDSEQRAEAQSAPTAALTEEQIKSCPDCGGSTWYYPEGPEKGIKRCRHEKLRTESREGK